MPLWGKEDKPSARPKSIKLKADGSLASDASGKKLVYLSKEEAQANANKGASGAGWYTALKTGSRTRLELLVAITDENRTSVNNVQFTETHLLNTNQAVTQDKVSAIADPNNRPGWYYTNDDDAIQRGKDLAVLPDPNTAGNKVNWYFYDGSDNITLGNFSAYAIVTTDDVSNDNAPFFAVYTTPLGTVGGVNDAASWYRSRRVYVPTATMTPGTKYLMYFGTNPDIHPTLPRIQLVLSSVPGSNRGPQLSNEKVSTSSLGSNSTSPKGGVKFVVESIGIVSPTVKRDIELRIDDSNASEKSSGLV